MDGPEIFLSYSAPGEPERALADHLRDLLEKAFDLDDRAVFAYTADESGITSGGRLKDELKAKVARCKVVLALVTRAAGQSQWVQWELGFGESEGKLVIPLLPAASFEVPTVLQDTTARTLDDLGQVCKLLEDLQAPLGRPVVPRVCGWIGEVQAVVAAAGLVAGEVPDDRRIEALRSEATQLREEKGALQRRARWLWGAVTLLVLALAASGYYLDERNDARDDAQAKLDVATEDVTKLSKEVLQMNLRSTMLPPHKLDGLVRTVSGSPAAGISVAACLALPSIGRPGEGPCPAEWVLSAFTDDEGRFSLDLGSLPLPDAGLRLGQTVDEVWLIPQAEGRSRPGRRVKITPTPAPPLQIGQ